MVEPELAPDDELEHALMENPMLRFVMRGAVAAATLAHLPILGAQAPLDDLPGTAVGDLTGRAVDGGSDIDGDLIPDWVVGSKRKVQVVSGATGLVIHELTASGQTFGEAVALPGDVNGDGTNDILVGSPEFSGAGQNAGSVGVYSGVDGGLLYSIPGPSPFDFFGRSLVGLGDLDGDDRADFAVGANRDNTIPGAPGQHGSVRIYSGATGQELLAIPGSVGGAEFGWHIDAVEDIDGDGLLDLVIAAPGDSYAVVHSSADGTEYFRVDVPGTPFGAIWQVAGVGDVNLDGRGDFMVGSAFNSASLHSGATGGLIRSHSGNIPQDGFGLSVSGAGDLNGDAIPDYLVGAPQPDNIGSGYVRAFCGRTGRELFTIEGKALGDGFGHDIAAAGTAKGDGAPCFVVGAPSANPGVVIDGGEGSLWSACPLTPHVYCTARTNSQGCTPKIAAVGGFPSAAQPANFEVRATQVLDGKPGIFFYGSSITMPGATPNFFGSWICVKTPITRTPPRNATATGAPPCTGVYTIALDELMLLDPALAPGQVVFGQWWTREPGLAEGFATTNAIEFTICP